jgi:uncharacterized membrane protein YgdD (TMEM256/DUF423 family)
MNNALERNVAATFGFLAILLGAFGAHALQGRLVTLGTTQFWQTAVLYHLVHGVVLLTLSTWRPIPKAGFYLISSGVAIFSGSLYVLALTNWKWVGAITPLGGLGMLVGWLALMVGKSRRSYVRMTNDK